MSYRSISDSEYHDWAGPEQGGAAATFEERAVARDAAMREGRDPESYVFVHDGLCNDYTGCNAGCTSAKLKDAVWDMGAWRER